MINYNRLWPQIARLTLLLLALNACNQAPASAPVADVSAAQAPASTPSTRASSAQEEILLSSAINGGYSLGYLASTYAPWIPEYSNAKEAREVYLMLAKDSAKFLGITLTPDPDSLLGAGRGQQQYDAIESYFSQMSEGSDQNSQCVNNLARMSVGAGWLLFNTFEARLALGNADYAQKFKEQFLEQLSKFAVFSAMASMYCEEDGYKDLSIMLAAIDNDSQGWEKRINLKQGDEIITEVISFRNELDDWVAALKMKARK